MRLSIVEHEIYADENLNSGVNRCRCQVSWPHVMIVFKPIVTTNPIPSLQHPLDLVKGKAFEKSNSSSAKLLRKKNTKCFSFFSARLDRFRSGALWRCTRVRKEPAKKIPHHRWQKWKRGRNVREASQRRWDEENAENIPQSGNCVRIGLKLKWIRNRCWWSFFFPHSSRCELKRIALDAAESPQHPLNVIAIRRRQTTLKPQFMCHIPQLFLRWLLEIFAREDFSSERWARKTSQAQPHMCARSGSASRSNGTRRFFSYLYISSICFTSLHSISIWSCTF